MPERVGEAPVNRIHSDLVEDIGRQTGNEDLTLETDMCQAGAIIRWIISSLLQ